MTVICLLRGVNVGSHQIKMAELRDLFAQGLGFQNVRTFIQSGNVLFETGKRPDAKGLEKAIHDRFGFQADVLLRTAAELDEAIARNPFAGREGIDNSKLIVTFLSRDHGQEAAARLQAMDLAGEEAHLVGNHLYMYFHEGVGKTKLRFPALAKAVGEPGTGRNWNSVLKLAAMARESGVKGGG
jgi:uncharacterized protein (DUF1697 family)